MTTLVTRRPSAAALTPTSLFNEPFRLLSEMNRWDPFAETSLMPSLMPWATTATFQPTFELKETPKELIVKADLPGVKENEFELTVAGNRLTISGKREEEKIQEGEKYHLIERTYGAFSRSLSLPEEVDANKIKAQLKDGVLMVNIPKSPEIQPKKVNIKVL